MSVEGGRSKKLRFFDLPPFTDLFEKKAKYIRQITSQISMDLHVPLSFKK